MTRPLRILLPAILLLAALLLLLRLNRPAISPPILAPREEILPEVLYEVGVLDPVVLARIHAPLSGTLSHVAEDGRRVRQGDTLFEFDQEEIRSNIENDEEQIDNRLEELDSAQTERDVLIQTYEAIHKRERAELEHAELELRIRTEGLLPEERRRLQISIELAELDLLDRQERLARQQELVDRNFAPPSSLDSVQREVVAAAALLEERRTQFQLDTQPLPEEERVTLQSAVDRAREAVERSRRRHQRDIENKDTEIQAIQLRLTHQRETLDDRRQDIEKSVVTAPVSGILRLTRSLNWRSRTWETIEIGRNTHTGNILGEIVDPGRLNLRVLIHESDILHVTPGLTADVILTAFPEHTLTGRVTSVSALGLDRTDLTPIHRQAPPAQQAQFLAEITVDTRTVDAMPGMTATVILHLQEPTP